MGPVEIDALRELVELFRKWIRKMADKAKKAVETVKVIGGEVADRLVGAGEAIAEGIKQVVTGDQAADDDRRRENAEAFAGRAERQRQRASERDARTDYERAVEGRVANFAALGDAATVEVRFSDGSTFVGGSIEAERTSFALQDRSGVYQRAVDFAPDGALFDVTEAWLVAGDASGGGIRAARCELGAPLKIGGGHQARIPAGFLIF